MSDIRWVEAWIDSAAGEYILIVRERDGRIEIVDLQKHGSIIQSFDSYDDALHWLNEDEYDRIEGRFALRQ
jgi:hypothetical protein